MIRKILRLIIGVTITYLITLGTLELFMFIGTSSDLIEMLMYPLIIFYGVVYLYVEFPKLFDL